jgi:hypothetical protein
MAATARDRAAQHHQRHAGEAQNSQNTGAVYSTIVSPLRVTA